MSLDMFEFELSPWDTVRDSLRPGQNMTAGHFLTFVEGEAEDVVEDAFRSLEELHITLDIQDLPKAPGTGEAAARLRWEEQLVARDGLMTELEENDPLRLYLEEVAGTPAYGDPQILAEDGAAGDESARMALVNVSLHRVISLAKEYMGRGVLLLDLIQEGSMGLWQSVLHYASGDFCAHRDWWIRHYLVNAVVMQAHNDGVGQKLRRATEDYRSVDERLLMELGRNPTVEEIAVELHMTPEEVGHVAGMMAAARNLAMAKTQQEPEEEEAEKDLAVEDTAYFQSRQRIAELLSALSPQDARLISLRFGLEGGLPLTPEETGRKLGLTAEEVVAREGAALALLRQG